jgi:ATP-dependent helicase/nuclease subunit B
LNGGEPAGEHLTFDKLDAALVAAQHFTALQHLIGQYDQEATPYRSRPRAQFVARYGDYDHLARVLEWSTAGGGDGGDGGDGGGE